MLALTHARTSHARTNARVRAIPTRRPVRPSPEGFSTETTRPVHTCCLGGDHGRHQPDHTAVTAHWKKSPGEHSADQVVFVGFPAFGRAARSLPAGSATRASGVFLCGANVQYCKSEAESNPTPSRRQLRLTASTLGDSMTRQKGPWYLSRRPRGLNRHLERTTGAPAGQRSDSHRSHRARSLC